VQRESESRHRHRRMVSRGSFAVRWSIAVRSGADVAQRGGDVFEAFVHGDGKTSLLLADVSSKGTLGVLHAEMLRNAFLDAARTSLRPRAIAARLNQIRLDTAASALNTTFASAFVASFEAKSGELTYASAGHEPSILFRDHEHQHLMPTGPVAGIIPDALYEERAVPFGDRDLLVIATDGVTASRNAYEPSLEFGTTGVVKAMAYRTQRTGCSTAELVLRCSDSFSNGVYRDDATVVAIRR
jgi:serine phosphatase RsbU (regulator of sigma subunit)